MVEAFSDGPSDEELEKKLEYFKKALSIDEKNGFLDHEAHDHFVIGDILYEKEDYINALKHYEKCLEIRMRLNLESKFIKYVKENILKTKKKLSK
jgi:tetratricopeptide (TPR) repeat protein